MAVSIGLPLHNGRPHLSKAIESLLDQTVSDFRLVIFDDGSSDGSDEIAQDYARRDRRVSFERSSRRTGLVNAWRHVAELAGRRGDVTWFAWFSDHDLVEPNWLEQLLEAARSSPRHVLAHAKTVAVDDHGTQQGDIEPGPDTRGLSHYERIRAVTVAPYLAGDAIYGLMRYEALRRCGFFPRAILPDRLVVSELALHGDLVFVPSTIRCRRILSGNGGRDLVSRQLGTLLPAGQEFKYPYLNHATYFLRRLDAPGTGVDSLQRVYHALLYFQKHYLKFRDPLQEELALAASDEEEASIVEFAAAVTRRKWKLSDHDVFGLMERLRHAKARLVDAKAANRALVEENGVLRSRCEQLLWEATHPESSD